MKLGFIGDVHGDMKKLNDIINSLIDYDLIIQVGDMGAGFTAIPEFQENVKWIRGNHDNPAISRAHPNYLGEYGSRQITLNGHHLFFLSGAWSIDRCMRIEDRDWWRDEQLSNAELANAVELYKDIKPEIVVTHDCPYSLLDKVLKPYLLFGGDGIKTSTGNALQVMFEAHQPQLWVFGHYHVNVQTKINGTDFHCLGINSSLGIEL